MMRAVFASSSSNLCELRHVPIPPIGPHQILVRVRATAMNRADTLQRAGKYPNPPGTTEIMGLEISGEVVDMHPGVLGFARGDRVMALVPGGGFAEFCACHFGSVMKIPSGMGFETAAGVPEVWLTAFQLLFWVGRVAKSDRVLIHAAASGVGTSMIQMVRDLGCKEVFAITSAGKLGAVRGLGATEALDRNSKWEEEKGVCADLILDCVGASVAGKNSKVVAEDGRWVVYGLMGGAASPDSLMALILRKRVAMLGSTLRSRSDEYKGNLVKDFVNSGALDKLASGVFVPVMDKRSFKGLEQVNEALDYMRRLWL